MNLQSDDFDLFGLARRFELDRAALDVRWKELQREAHPDRFAAQGAAAQRLAMQWSVRINEAYQRLKDPLRRAAYLCELSHTPVQAHTNTAMPESFLLQQMAWREALEEATDGQQVQKLQSEVASAQADLLMLVKQQLDVQRDTLAAAQSVRSLMFLEKFGRDVESALEKFE